MDMWREHWSFGSVRSCWSCCTFPFSPHLGGTKVSLHRRRGNVFLLDGFVEGGDGEDGSGLLVGYPAGPGPVGDRMQASSPPAPSHRAVSYFQSICAGLCGATVVNALSANLNWGGRKRLAFMICLSSYSLRLLFGGDNKHGEIGFSEICVEKTLLMTSEAGRSSATANLSLPPALLLCFPPSLRVLPVVHGSLGLPLTPPQGPRPLASVGHSSEGPSPLQGTPGDQPQPLVCLHHKAAPPSPSPASPTPRQGRA
ncbi:uncharacterized protein LOC116589808 [Mustela erminea]|uniref:uncharacterized protein LOC116589808 n=1 Tax=Mustela erminea TaxID=36723 RepID=UPI001386F920|nr:uncharacterized protein LOC116589808 [Mustela erminea]